MKLHDLAPVGVLEKSVPARTHSYMPVPNRVLLETMEENILGMGFEIDSANMELAANNNKLVGTVRLKSDKVQDFGMTLGFRNSYDKSMSVGFGIGGEVFVCNNGMFLADVTTLRKHTTNVWGDIDRILKSQLQHAQEVEQQLHNDMMDMKHRLMSKAQLKNLMWDLYVEEKLITGVQFNIVKSELYNSKNFAVLGPDHKPIDGENSVWNVYNNITHSLKKSHPTRYFQDHARVHKKMMAYV